MYSLGFSTETEPMVYIWRERQTDGTCCALLFALYTIPFNFYIHSEVGSMIPISHRRKVNFGEMQGQSPMRTCSSGPSLDDLWVMPNCAV